MSSGCVLMANGDEWKRAEEGMRGSKWENNSVHNEQWRKNVGEMATTWLNQRTIKHSYGWRNLSRISLSPSAISGSLSRFHLHQTVRCVARAHFHFSLCLWVNVRFLLISHKHISFHSIEWFCGWCAGDGRCREAPPRKLHMTTFGIMRRATAFVCT